jgi:hypothetical protein
MLALVESFESHQCPFISLECVDEYSGFFPHAIIAHALKCHNVKVPRFDIAFSKFERDLQ